MTGRGALNHRIAVTLGGSAGGFEALCQILEGLPREFSLPIVVVLHVSSKAASRLPETLAWNCKLPVEEARDKALLQAGRVYVAPPDYHVLFDSASSLALSVDPPVHFSRPSIDVLFESAADALGCEAVGVLLSGANRDGANGLRAIANAGGKIMIQRPDEAASPTMPSEALRTCPTGRAMRLSEICSRLREIDQMASRHTVSDWLTSELMKSEIMRGKP